MQAHLAVPISKVPLRIIIMPAAGGESSSRNLKVASQLDVWALKNGRGEAFDSSVQFMLPDGSGFRPMRSRSFPKLGSILKGLA